MKITDREYKQIMNEVADRLKDIIFLNAKPVVKRELNKKHLEGFLSVKDYELEVHYKFTLIVNDFRQMLGRIRRENKVAVTLLKIKGEI